MNLFISLFCISIAGNLALSVLFGLSRRKKKQKVSYQESAADLIHDLTMRGQAVVRVEVIDAANLFLRSPRG